MTRRNILRRFGLALLLVLTPWAAGCGLTSQEVADLLNAAVGDIQSQSQPQNLPQDLLDQGDTIIIEETVTIIEDPATDISVIELPNQTILGFENLTGFDIYLQYLADGELQGVYVFDGEALLLDYPCLVSIELLSEDDIDPVSLDLVDSYDLSGAVFSNPQDFFCGDAFILTFEPDAVTGTAEVIDLVR